MVEITNEDSVIRVLESHVVDHIAAGEVIERPSAVLKELLENSIDAGASDVRVEIEEGGLARLRIEDDGCGMSQTDLRTCIKRHATSKIVEPDDLFGIETLGFRGEALSSIAAVAQVTIETKRRQDACGWRLIVRGGEILECDEAAVNDGTTIEVTDLFYNTPARRKFLRAPATEQSHVLDAALRVGMAQMHVALQVYHGSRRLLDLPRGVAPGVRLEAALGNRFPNADLFEHCSNEVAIQGFLAPPSVVRNDAKGIWVFVNGRYVRDRMFHRAVGDAFQERVPAGKHPVLAVYVDIDPAKLDVNVHPQKLEVRFSDGQAVFQAFSEALAVARQLPGWSERLGSSTADTRALGLGVEQALGRYFETAKTPSSDSTSGMRSSAYQASHRTPPANPRVSSPVPRASEALPKTVQLGLGMKIESPPTWEELDVGAPRETPEPSLSDAWQLLAGGIAVKLEKGGLRIVDWFAASQNTWVNRGLEDFKEGGLTADKRVIPVILEWPESRVSKVEEHLERLSLLGFKLSTFEGRRVAVLSTPAGLDIDGHLEEVLVAVCDKIEEGEDVLLRQLARHVNQVPPDADTLTSLQAGVASDVLSADDLRALLRTRVS